MKKSIKKIIMLICFISMESFATIVSDDDKDAFLSRSEYEFLKSNYQSQIENHLNTIDSSIDRMINEYLVGLTFSTEENVKITSVAVYGNKFLTYGRDLERYMWSHDGLVDNTRILIKRGAAYKAAWSLQWNREGVPYTKMLGYDPDTKNTYVRNNIYIKIVENCNYISLDNNRVKSFLSNPVLYCGNVYLGTPETGLPGWDEMFPSNITFFDITTDRYWQWIDAKNTIDMGNYAFRCGEFICDNAGVSNYNNGQLLYDESTSMSQIGLEVSYDSQQQFELLTGGDQSEGAKHFALPYRTEYYASSVNRQMWPLSAKISDLFTGEEDLTFKTIWIDPTHSSYSTNFKGELNHKKCVAGYTRFPNMETPTPPGASGANYVVCNDMCIDSYMKGASKFVTNEARNKENIIRKRNEFFPIYENKKNSDVTIKFSVTLSNTGYATVDSAGTKFYFATDKNKLINGNPNIDTNLLAVKLNNVAKDKNNIVLSSGNTASFEIVVPNGKSLWMAYKSTATGMIGTNSKWLSFDNEGIAYTKWDN